jgi:hypothetical protein
MNAPVTVLMMWLNFSSPVIVHKFSTMNAPVTVLMMWLNFSSPVIVHKFSTMADCEAARAVYEELEFW